MNTTQPVSACVQDVLFDEERKTSASPRQTKLSAVIRAIRPAALLLA
jgi:hypothetical protein